MNTTQLTDKLGILKNYIYSESPPSREKIIKNIENRLNNGAFVSYSQNSEDVILNRIFKDKEQGTYVDIGAYDPFEKSLTNTFYQRGWSGINIDLCDENIQKFSRARPRDINLCTAVGSRNCAEKFYVQPGTTRSTKLKSLGENYIHRGLNVQIVEHEVKTLKSILSNLEVAEIDFLSIDVEGAEKDVLLGIDFNQFRPTVIVAEATYPETDTPNWEDWEGLLIQNKYECAYYDGLNRFYIQSKDEYLRKHFKLPPNYFDNFIRYEQIICALAI